MNDFVVSARKYRPETFDTVVGQENITRTLLKAVESNHLAQAFLFCGPRGVGKTTCARIMARTVNQLNDPNANHETDYSFNIFELDAASNNSVDDIRNLIDQVRIPPQTGKYKVYIIDEVHMLSSNAFNAFLKTLEEPPPYAIFILATTEKHKVLPTILSRCQIYDFSRIQIPDMVAHLNRIAEKEGVSISDDALHVIAEKADGALRDALSIFDQMVSFAGNTVTYTDVITNLNVLDHEYYFGLTDAFIDGNRSKALLTFNDILKKGFDGHNFITGLSHHIRNLLFATGPETAALLETAENVRDRYLKQAEKSSTDFLVGALHILNDADSAYKLSKNQRLLVEIALLKLCDLSGNGVKKKTEPKAASAPTLTNQKNQPITAPKPLNEDKHQPAAPTPTTEIQPHSVQRFEEPEPDPLVKVLSGIEQAKKVQSPPPAKEPLIESADLPPAPKPFVSRLSGMKAVGMASVSTLQAKVEAPDEGGQSISTLIVESASLVPDQPESVFNLAMLWEAWEAYAQQIKQSDRKSYYATLTDNKPVLLDAHSIVLKLKSQAQLTDLNNDKANLLGFLRERLNNWKITLEGIIDHDDADADAPGSKPYTPEEKFKAMVDKNPHLAQFRQALDLDLDYDG